MSEETEVAARVARGAEWLDKVHPGWERRIDLSVLVLSDCTKCVLGQLVPNCEYDTGYEAVLWAMTDGVGEIKAAQWATDHGFNAGGGLSAATRCRYVNLDAAWTDLIKSRFDTGALSDVAS